MKVIIGIDIGGSTTKIAGFTEEGELVGSLQVRAADQLTSLYGALGHFLHDCALTLDDIGKVVLTGVGASHIEDDIYGLPTYKIEEFQAVGYGGLLLSHLDKALVVSMGTGTAYIRAEGQDMRHIGGSGVGGGTLLGLSSKLIKEDHIAVLSHLAESGDLSQVDLTIGDICREDIPSLPSHLTAANFGKINSMATKQDLAYGLINMVFQTIGMLAVFACRNDSVKDVVLVGALTVLPQAAPAFQELSRLHGIRFLLPQRAVFATAIGAVVPYLKKRPAILDEDEPGKYFI